MNRDNLTYSHGVDSICLFFVFFFFKYMFVVYQILFYMCTNLIVFFYLFQNKIISFHFCMIVFDSSIIYVFDLLDIPGREIKFQLLFNDFII